MEIHITNGNNLPNNEKILLIEIVVSGITKFVTIEVNTLTNDEVNIFQTFESYINNKNLYVIENSPFSMAISIVTPNIIIDEILVVNYDELIKTDREIISSMYQLILSKIN